MENKIMAVCLKTYPDDDDMEAYVRGEIEPCEVRIYYMGKTYPVVDGYYDNEYWMPLSEQEKIVRSVKEIRGQIENAETATNKGLRNHKDMSFEETVCFVLEWVLGEEESEPIQYY